MAKFPEAEARLIRNKFVCRKCKTTLRAPMRKVLSGDLSCQTCGGHVFKPKRKK